MPNTKSRKHGIKVIVKEATKQGYAIAEEGINQFTSQRMFWQNGQAGNRNF